MSVEDTEVVLTLTLIDQDGNAIASSQEALAPLGHLAKFVDEFTWDTPPDFSSFRGVLKVSADGSVAATVLQSRSGEFATLPVRMMATVVGAFGIVALLLAAVGLYGVLAFWVNQGVRDLAIRMALGARPADVVLQVARRGMWMTGIGESRQL